MNIDLTANTEKTVTFDNPTRKIVISNKTGYEIRIRPDMTVAVDTASAFVLGPHEAKTLQFDRCAVLHLISASDGTVEITIMSILKSPQSDTLVADTVKVFDLIEEADWIQVKNLDSSNNVSFCRDKDPTIGADGTYTLAPGESLTLYGKCMAIHCISSGTPKVEIIAGEV